jgi:hypothetical protein
VQGVFQRTTCTHKRLVNSGAIHRQEEGLKCLLAGERLTCRSQSPDQRCPTISVFGAVKDAGTIPNLLSSMQAGPFQPPLQLPITLPPTNSANPRFDGKNACREHN